MKPMQTAVLLVALLAASAAAMQQYNYVSRIITGGHTCDSRTCGINARCTIVDDHTVCSCLNLHMGDPLKRCDRVECLIDEDCIGTRNCVSNKCTDPCAYVCGTNAVCQTRNHVPNCSCPPGYVGDPFKHCIYDPQAPCRKNPCGINTKCEVVNGVTTCTCLPGYRGQPFVECHHECERDSQCPHYLTCSSNFKCENPCASQCGQDAECVVVNHRVQCSCPKNWIGNPRILCKPECTYDVDCPSSKPACHYQKCVNPCDGVCGTNANCELSPQRSAVCSCPRDRTGDPFTNCRLFTDEDLCKPNPCGVNAECHPGHDNTGEKRPVCTCPAGYIGNALQSCQRGECFTDSDCPDHLSCSNYTCQSPCTGHECGINASCTPRRHIAVCTCNDGYRGDALITCNPIDSGRSHLGSGRYIRYHSA